MSPACYRCHAYSKMGLTNKTYTLTILARTYVSFSAVTQRRDENLISFASLLHVPARWGWGGGCWREEALAGGVFITNTYLKYRTCNILQNEQGHTRKCWNYSNVTKMYLFPWLALSQNPHYFTGYSLCSLILY